MTITPEMAQNWLDHANTGNRPLRERYAEQIAGDIKQGAFRMTPEAIAFDVNGRLIAGQHRLRAIAIANKAIPLQVCFDAPPDAQAYMDQGRRQTLTDAVKFQLRDRICRRAEATARIMASSGDVKTCRTRQELFRFFKRHRDPIDFAVSAFDGNPNAFAHSFIMAAVARAFAAGEDLERLKLFASQLKDGVVKSSGDRAVVKLRDELLNKRKPLPGSSWRKYMYFRTEYLLGAYLDYATSVSQRRVEKCERWPLPGEKITKAK